MSRMDQFPDPEMEPYDPEHVPPEESLERARAFRELMDGRRTVRTFSHDPVEKQVIQEILHTAGTAPSGAHKQPWTFVAIQDQNLKQELRKAAEEQEQHFYEELAPQEWLQDLAPLGTDWEKTHMTNAPWLIVVFAQDYALDEDGNKRKHYYVNESVGIAVGFLLAAIRKAGLVALTHTPSPMEFLREKLDRPKNERAYVVIPVGYPAEDCEVPALERKELHEFVEWK